MKKIVTTENLNIYDSKIIASYFLGKKCCVFDIETTGLNFNWDKIVLTAVLTIENDKALVTQFLAEEPKEEAKIIEETLNYLNDRKVDFLMTYNGDGFDIPFFNIKMKKYFKTTSLEYYNMDLYKIFRNHSTLKSLTGSLSQKSMEAFMGIDKDRYDTIDGGKSAELYKTYVKTKDKKTEDLILTHNREDVIQLYKLLPLIKFCDFHNAMYDNGFPFMNLYVKPRLIKGYLKISGKQYHSPLSIDTFGNFSYNYEAHFDETEGIFEILIPTFQEKNGKYLDAGFIENNSGELPLINGYLIVEEEELKKHREINLFSMLVIEKILSDYS